MDLPDVANGDVFGFALDMDNGRLYIHQNGTYLNSGDPAAGTGFLISGIVGTFFPAYCKFGGASVITANFGATAFAHSVPTGFTAGVTA